MSRLIRLMAGDLSAHDILNDDDALIVNWDRTSDMPSAIRWRASQPEGTEMKRQFRPSLSRGSGNWYGLYSGAIEFWSMTGLMREYIHVQIMNSKPIALVTAFVHSSEHDEYQVFTGELVIPFAIDSPGEYSRFSDDHYTNSRFAFRRARLKVIEALATEADEGILTEAGELIVLEQQS